MGNQTVGSTPLGIKLVRIYLIVLLIPTLFLFASALVCKITLKSPDSYKVTSLRGGGWKKLGITTIEQMDARLSTILTGLKTRIKNKIADDIIVLILTIGIWSRKPWSRIAIIVCFAVQTVWTCIFFFLGPGKATPIPLSNIFQILAFVGSIIYLSRPNTRGYFTNQS